MLNRSIHFNETDHINNRTVPSFHMEALEYVPIYLGEVTVHRNKFSFFSSFSVACSELVKSSFN